MKILIVGGGITGLSTAWFLHKQHPNAKITLFEKEARLGGWIRTSQEGGFFFEKGPRTFQMGRSPHLLSLIHELKLEILHSDPKAAKRFILHKGKLCSAASFIPQLIPYLIRELFIAPSKSADDESIYDFACRRFSARIAERFFDPMTLGVYAGNIHKLSLRACFPTLYKWEREKGSLVRGLFSSGKKAKGLFTLKNGMETLLDALKTQLPIEIICNCPVDSFNEKQVFAAGKTWCADHVISALPSSLPAQSIWVVNLAYHTSVLPKKGFGYLVPTQEREALLGVIFDSCIFPQQNLGQETRLTAMLRAEENAPLETTLSALQRHLFIQTPPTYSSIFLAKEAIPQFEVGCGDVEGISVEACIERATKLSMSISSKKIA